VHRNRNAQRDVPHHDRSPRFGSARPTAPAQPRMHATSGAMIVVTALDGKQMALNVDRIERVETNDATNDTNVYLIGGSHLIVTALVEEIIEAITEAKSRVLARALSFAGTPLVGPAHPAGSTSGLHVVQPESEPT
jgi:uncharacterized protein YlzI (FlbEa/FlbD family)